MAASRGSVVCGLSCKQTCAPATDTTSAARDARGSQLHRRPASCATTVTLSSRCGSVPSSPAPSPAHYRSRATAAVAGECPADKRVPGWPGPKDEHRRCQRRHRQRSWQHRPVEGTGGRQRTPAADPPARHPARRRRSVAQPWQSPGDDLHRFRRGRRIREQLRSADHAQGRRRGPREERHAALVAEHTATTPRWYSSRWTCSRPR